MSYRQAALACPGCAAVLEPKQVGETTIDVCPACGGIWVDWFDGELSEMVRGAPRTTGTGTPGRAGSSTCPRDGRPLDAERYLASRAEILRCGDCSGAFVPRAAAHEIAAMDPERKGPPPAEDGWSRLAAVLQRWFGWEETPPQ